MSGWVLFGKSEVKKKNAVEGPRRDTASSTAAEDEDEDEAEGSTAGAGGTTRQGHLETAHCSTTLSGCAKSVLHSACPLPQEVT